MTHKRLIGIAGLSAWIIVGLPSFVYHAGAPSSDWRWIVAFLIFGAAFAADLVRPHFVLLVAESAAAISLILLSCNGYEGTLLVVSAMQLGPRLNRVSGVTWVLIQTFVLSVGVAIRLNPRSALVLGPPYLGFQLLAFFVFHIMAREITTRIDLDAANAELRALQQILADSSRMAERLRIAHELHDALGHRLTVLTLNLEALLQSTQGAIKARVEACQSLTRQLLGDVREIVADSKTAEGLSVAQALQTLITAVPRPRVHLEVAEGMRIFDPEGTHILFRCVQEIMTNAARHSGAENLWILIEQDGESVRLRAHDDGRGSDGRNDGFGLRGMRERIERAGGEIHFSTQPGRGFGVTAMLPVRIGAV
jgi:signal transduction histidine kinase